MVTGEDLDDGRLARPVLADQGMDLARRDLEIDGVESPLTGKGLAQRVDAQGGIQRCYVRGRGTHSQTPFPVAEISATVFLMMNLVNCSS